MPRPSRIHMAVVVVGGTLAVLALLAFQVVLPFAFGPWGLVAVAAADLGVFLVYRHRRVVRRVPPGYLLGRRESDRQRLAARRANAAAKRLAGSVLVAVFVLGLYAAGWAIRVDAMVNGPSLGPYLLGAVMSLLGGGLAVLISYDYTLYVWRPGMYDTTEDH